MNDGTEPAAVETEWQRQDGVTIFETAGGWAIRRGSMVISLCPVCGKPMVTPQEARQVSEKVYPPDRQPPKVQTT